MSLEKIKKECETHLYSNWTDTQIAYGNVPFKDTPNNYLQVFVVPISDERELVNHNEPFKISAFFQMNIKVKLNLGTAIHYTYEKALKTLFREQNLNGVSCPRVATGAMFQDGEYMVLPFRVVCEVWG